MSSNSTQNNLRPFGEGWRGSARGGSRAADPIVPRGWRRASGDCLSELAAVTKDGGTLRKVPHHVPEQKARRVVFRLSLILSLHLSLQSSVAPPPLAAPPFPSSSRCPRGYASREIRSLQPPCRDDCSSFPSPRLINTRAVNERPWEKGIAGDTFFSSCSACWVTSGEDVDPHPRFLPHVCKLGLFGWLEMIYIVL